MSDDSQDLNDSLVAQDLANRISYTCMVKLLMLNSEFPKSIKSDLIQDLKKSRGGEEASALQSLRDGNNRAWHCSNKVILATSNLIDDLEVTFNDSYMELIEKRKEELDRFKKDRAIFVAQNQATNNILLWIISEIANKSTNSNSTVQKLFDYIDEFIDVSENLIPLQDPLVQINLKLQTSSLRDFKKFLQDRITISDEKR